MKVAIVLSVLLLASCVLSLDNGLGKTPQMGWNSWNHFGCSISETLIRQTAETIAKSPLKDAGYNYVNIDDCWQVSRDKNGVIQADNTTFPSGIKVLADYVHSLGLKFGLYSCAGFKTCAGRPGSLGFEEIDAKTYASWGVDYLKYDNCNTDGSAPEKRYTAMRDALNKTGRPIFYSMCEWGDDSPAYWAPKVGNSWRTTDDIQDNWVSMLSNLDFTSRAQFAAAPGGWNDADMLEVGNGGMTHDEYVAHFSLWAIIKSPLIIGNDITKMDDATLKILTNTEVIAVNQDPLGIQGVRIVRPRTDFTNASVITMPCTGAKNQQWTVHNTDKTIRSLLTGTCLDVSECSKENIGLTVFPCHIGAPNQPCDSKNQQWNITTTISNVWSNKCVNVWKTSGPSVLQWPCNTEIDEKWQYDASTAVLQSAIRDSDPNRGGCLTVQDFTDQELYVAPLKGGDHAVVLLNRGPATTNITVFWTEIGVAAATKLNVRDLWQHKDLGVFTEKFSTPVTPHSVVMVKIGEKK